MTNGWLGFGIPTSIHLPIPPELSSKTALLSYLGVSPAEMKKIWYHREKMYHCFDVAKKSGKPRLINAPDRRLKFLQRRIANLLDQLYRVRNPVHGYVQGKSVKSNATSHLKQRFILNLDIRDFFGSISERRVFGVLHAIGVPRDAAETVARICCYSGHLPQGGPASPVLSNMVCFRLDRALLKLAKDSKCIYTRYADDISLSSLRPLTALFDGTLPTTGRVDPELLSAALQAAFTSNGFALNPEKIHYADRHSRRVVTGLKVNEGLNVDRRFVRNIRAALYEVEKDAVAAQARYAADFGGKADISSHLKGKIAWLGNVKGLADPVYRALALRFNTAFPKRAIKVQPTRHERLDRSVWVIEHHLNDIEKYAQGSVFFLAGVGLVTAAHCVAGVKDAIVHHPSRPSNKFKVSVAHYSKHRDLAILTHSIPATDFYELSKSAAAAVTGDPIVAIGYPDFSPADKVNFREGTVSSTTVKSLINLLEVNFKFIQGMSGGPVINSNDEVVGIVHKGGPKEKRDFAIVIEEFDSWNAAGLPSDY
ncbi:reverse transcriptase domain-containing protein [Qipengyuania nanhaisediminis]|uniref:RNA-directed DNA polymerase n=1 Tax=Qipengyuania nanhaisediminis TaxID=604088 RepID=A0A1I5N2L0_9SPHN|nr:reverse transcriptase domain-containing protein [Qipengyuania nanhaisediminis]SFP16135.1 Trypsin-like peptidase domain-containing protein [Qipengyuania nanhaisediminis]